MPGSFRVNLGLLACQASTVLTEPHPQPQHRSPTPRIAWLVVTFVFSKLPCLGFFLFVCSCFFETRSHQVALDDLEFTMESSPALNPQRSSCFCLPNGHVPQHPAVTMEMMMMVMWMYWQRLKLGFCAYQASTPLEELQTQPKCYPF